MRLLGLIPARGGSKGIKRKNVKLLCGQPLIKYTVDVVLQCSYLTEVMVSTEDPEIARIASDCGASVPSLRPRKLATDESPTIDTVHYTLRQYEESGVLFDAVVLLQPTTPMREVNDLLTSIRKFIAGDHDSLISVIKVPEVFNPNWIFEQNNGELKLVIPQKEIIARRQDLPTYYIRSGDIYITKTDIILDRYSLYGDSIGFYEMPQDRHVNIDTDADWQRAVELLKSGER